MPEIRIPNEAYSELAALVSNLDKLPALSEAAAVFGPSLSRRALGKAIADRTGTSAPDADLMVNGLLNLLHLCDETERPPADVISLVTRALEEYASPEWRSKHLDAWRLGDKTLVAALTPDGPLAILYKTRQLTIAHQSVLESAQILTDIRPVFNSDASKILRAVITHMLVVTYRDSDESRTRTAYYALDTGEVQKLKVACERVSKKAATIKDDVSSLPWSTEIAGESE